MEHLFAIQVPAILRAAESALILSGNAPFGGAYHVSTPGGVFFFRAGERPGGAGAPLLQSFI